MKKKIIVLIVILVLCFTCLFIFERVHGISMFLRLKLNGGAATVKLGEEYIDEGVSAKYMNKDVDVTTSNDIDNTKVGSYSYTYKVTYKKISKEIQRTINVVDEEPPTITLNGRNDLIIVKGSKYTELGAKATDKYDGDITDINISGEVNTNEVGTYQLVYTAKDSSNNEANAIRTINVVDSKAYKIPVLNYHFFYNDGDGCRENLCVHVNKFKDQLKYLKENGYYTITIKEFTDWMYGNIELPNKSVLITVDDGGWGTGTDKGNYLIPALEENDMYATLFLVTGFWGPEAYQSPNLDVESHTNNLHHEKKCGHRSMVNCVPYETVLNDLKETIDILGTKEAFCFPFYEATDTSVQAVKDAGFKVSFAGRGGNVTRNTDKYRIPRYAVYDSTTMEQFIKMVEV